MVAPLRIAPHKGLHGKEYRDAGQDYLERLVKLIPGEVVALYLVGRSQILNTFSQPLTAGATQILSPSAAWIGWTLFCLAGLILVRRWATSSQALGVPPEWPAVGIAAVSFLIWVYSFGDVFKDVYHAWDPLLASLLVLGWVFLVPFIYAPKRELQYT